jgi:hypothetical protein
MSTETEPLRGDLSHVHDAPGTSTRPITCPRAAHAPTSPTNNTPRTTASYTTPRGTTLKGFG